MKDRSKLFIKLQQKIKKRAQSFLEEENSKEICNLADEAIEETKIGRKRGWKDCKRSLLILKDLMQ